MKITFRTILAFLLGIAVLGVGVPVGNWVMHGNHSMPTNLFELGSSKNTSNVTAASTDKFYDEASQKLNLAKNKSANANVLAQIAAAGNGSPDVAKMAIQNATDAKNNSDSVQQLVKLMSNKTLAQEMWEKAAQYGRDATNATTIANGVSIPTVKTVVAPEVPEIPEAPSNYVAASDIIASSTGTSTTPVSVQEGVVAPVEVDI